MQSYNHSAAWIPHHSTSLNVQQRPAPPPRPRYTTLPSAPYPPRHSSHGSTDLPPISYAPVPASLTPGRQRPRPAANMSFPMPTPSFPARPSPFVPSPERTSFYGDYFYSPPQPPLPPPPLPQKPRSLLPAPPIIPPKPPTLSPVLSPGNPLYPQAISGSSIAGPSSLSFGAIPESPTDEKDIALALALSASEARQREEDMLAQEEEELARALEESRLIAGPYTRRHSLSPQGSHGRNSPVRTHGLSPVATTSSNPSLCPSEGVSWLHLITPTESMHSLDEEPSIPPSTAETGEGSRPVHDGTSPQEQHPANEVPQENREQPRPTSDTRSLETLHRDSPTPPLYNNVVSSIVLRNAAAVPTSPTSPSSQTSAASFPSAESHRSDLTQSPHVLHTVPSRASSLSQINAPEVPPAPSRPSWSSANTSDSGHSARLSAHGDSSSAAHSSQSPQFIPASPQPSFASTTNLDPLGEDTEDDLDDPASRPTPGLSANHYVEPELLFGISLGFSRPAISTILSHMSGQMPPVICLPYGKSPTYHIQAPNWRQLLKLMARLSGTRVEPSLEALSVAKHELKLRTVIQFVKIHHSSSEWRTVLYLTTEMPLPPSVNNAHKYTNGDVTVLPYSYTLSPLPTLLRDGAESPMAKYYVVPATPSTPYPTLPMNFPSLAMYLQSAVQDSRKAANDSSSGMRKLANYIDTCYPNDFESGIALGESDASRRGMGGMFKRVIGRGKAPKVGRGGNDEVYDLVTPFVMEEWG